MATYAQRRKARLLARRRLPFLEDPENAERQADCARQMAIFDQMTPAARARVHEGADNFDTVEALRRLQNRGPGDRARRALKERGLYASDVPLPEVVSLDLVG